VLESLASRGRWEPGEEVCMNNTSEFLTEINLLLRVGLDVSRTLSLGYEAYI
jgi:hypothetical protein